MKNLKKTSICKLQHEMKNKKFKTSRYLKSVDRFKLYIPWRRSASKVNNWSWTTFVVHLWITNTLNDVLAAVDDILAQTRNRSNEIDSDSSNDDHDNTGGSGVCLTSNYDVGSNDGESHKPTQTYSRRCTSDNPNRRNSNLNVEYGHQHSCEHHNLYTSNDPPNHGHSTSGYTGGNFYYGINETYSDISVIKIVKLRIKYKIMKKTMKIIHM